MNQTKIQYQRQIKQGKTFVPDMTWDEKPPRDILCKTSNVYGTPIRFVKITTIIEEVK